MKPSSGKFQFWECKKPPVDAGKFCSSPILVFDISPCFRSLTFCCADVGIFHKSLKIKMTGKTAGDSPHELQ
jgi:hypothetical protein